MRNVFKNGGCSSRAERLPVKEKVAVSKFVIHPKLIKTLTGKLDWVSSISVRVGHSGPARRDEDLLIKWRKKEEQVALAYLESKNPFSWARFRILLSPH